MTSPKHAKPRQRRTELLRRSGAPSRARKDTDLGATEGLFGSGPALAGAGVGPVGLVEAAPSPSPSPEPVGEPVRRAAPAKARRGRSKAPAHRRGAGRPAAPRPEPDPVLDDLAPLDDGWAEPPYVPAAEPAWVEPSPESAWVEPEPVATWAPAEPDGVEQVQAEPVWAEPEPAWEPEPVLVAEPEPAWEPEPEAEAELADEPVAGLAEPEPDVVEEPVAEEPVAEGDELVLAPAEERPRRNPADTKRTLRRLGISVNPPPPPERPARFDSATVTYPSSATARAKVGAEVVAIRRPRRRPPSPETIPPLPAPVVRTDLPQPAKPLQPGLYLPPPELRRSRDPNYGLRRLGVLVALIAIGAVSFASYSATRPGPPTAQQKAALAAAKAKAARLAAAGPGWFVVPKRTEPGGGTTLFPSHRLVAYYGVPDNPALGVLGNAPPAQLWSQLAATTAPYDQAGKATVPSYELIAYTAEAAPGPDGTYTQALPASTIAQYQQVVDAHDGMLILDIQPGRANFLTLAKTLAPFLTDPHVGLALDPEWELQPGQLPAKQVGHTTAAEINQVSTWLQQLTVANDLPQKLLLIHQFQTQMIRDKQDVAKEPDLSIAFNMDGFGASENKLSVYNLVASDPRWALGYKLFYTRDTPLQTPQEVLGLQPQPSIIEYE